ncbi:hypothetical protein BRYFOR_05373 [Marvinbryantia formatexigens DSM 14469]|uniref:Uncharacterized protein n=2 Tax=Marvinbryantia TaxID=248744 RepID=C6L9T3_9FIRM|nr:hypothetical protein BRYFOR_05373 [Marvinbryantia formatexigens DSM 14469]
MCVVYGGVIMATSSIFAKIKISDPKKAAAFIDALAASEDKPERKPSVQGKFLLTDRNDIRKFMEKRFPDNG